MKIEIVTPAGRQRYLELLFLHLKSQKAHFDNWTLWMNTMNQSDIDFCKKLEKENEWVKTITLSAGYSGNGSISSFFKYAQDHDSIYIRFDDDIVWIEQDFIKKISKFRLENPQYFLVYANIINNAIIDHIHQRIGALEYKDCLMGYNCLDGNGWANPDSAEIKHRNFLEKKSSNNINCYKFDKWDLIFNERASINCVSWLGRDLNRFVNKYGLDLDNPFEEEQILSVDYPKSKGLINTIYGQAICSHFAFFTQREKMDKSNILEEYKLLTQNI